MNDNEILNQIKDLAGQLTKRADYVLEVVNDIQSGRFDREDELEWEKDRYIYEEEEAEDAYKKMLALSKVAQ